MTLSESFQLIYKYLYISRILSQMGCGESFEGVAVGADMYHQQNVKVFIGPYCNAELDAVAKMAS